MNGYLPPADDETKRSRLLIADDHPLFRGALRQMLEGQPDFEMLLPLSIVVSFNGRRVWGWSRPAWGVLAVATLLGLFLIRG